MTMTGRAGYRHTYVRAILKDRNGFAWLATGRRLVRYDGAHLDLAWKRGELEHAVVRSRLGRQARLRYGNKLAPLEIRAGGMATVDGSLRTH